MPSSFIEMVKQLSKLPFLFNLRIISMSCSECHSTTVWDDDVGSAVCTNCGSLTDPSQSVLTSAHWNATNDSTSLWDPSASTTLKSLRAGNNWDIAGQGKEPRDRKNTVNIISTILINFLIKFFF